MNKKLGVFFAVGFAAFMAACSDMAINSDDAVGMPGDFDLDQYVAINKDIKIQQIKKDLKDHRAYNPARQDSAANSYLVGKDKKFVISPVPPEGKDVEFAKEARAAARASISADEKNFLADSILVKEIFKDYLGLADSLWHGVDSLDKNIKSALLDFNKQQIGAPDSKEDREFLENFVFDTELLAKHYLLLGSMEGRAYRYCNASDSKTVLKSEVVPDTISANAAVMLNYSAYAFCLDSASQNLYSVK